MQEKKITAKEIIKQLIRLTFLKENKSLLPVGVEKPNKKDDNQVVGTCQVYPDVRNHIAGEMTF